MKILYTLILASLCQLTFSQPFDTVYLDKSGRPANSSQFEYYEIIQPEASNSYAVSKYYKDDSLQSTFTMITNSSRNVSNKNLLKLISKNKLMKDGTQYYYIHDTVRTKKIVWASGHQRSGPYYFQGNAEFFISKDDTIYTKLEQMPQFQGGDIKDFKVYVQSKLVYPENPKRYGIHGVVKIQFIVNKDGSVKHPLIEKGVDPQLDSEAIKTIKGSPDWTPGYFKGRAVSVKYVIPVEFVIK